LPPEKQIKEFKRAWNEATNDQNRTSHVSES
jgi:hypothetical protein